MNEEKIEEDDVKFWMKELKKEDKITLRERAKRQAECFGAGFNPGVSIKINLMDPVQKAYVDGNYLGCLCLLRTLTERALKERINAEYLIKLDPDCKKFVDKRMKEIGKRGSEKDLDTKLGLMREYSLYYEQSNNELIDHLLNKFENATLGTIMTEAKKINILNKEMENWVKEINRKCNEFVHSNFIKNMKNKESLIKQKYIENIRKNNLKLSEEEINMNWKLNKADNYLEIEGRKLSIELMWKVHYFINIILGNENFLKHKDL